MGFRQSRWVLAQVWLAWILILGVVEATGTAAFAQTAPAIPTTSVSGTIYTATGAAASGTVLINWPAFSTWAGASVPAGSTSVTIGAGGALNVQLVPNAGSTPMGSYYTVVYHLSDGTVTREYWVVPASVGTVAISAIKSTVLPASVAMQTVSKSYVDTAIAAAVAGTPLTSSPYVLVAGDTMTGPLVLPADPTSPLQASDKNYVDTQVAGLASGLGQKVGTTPAATQTVSQPAGTDLAVNDLNSVQYASQYVTGAGNNGIANATATCTSGCDVVVEQTYPSVENIAPTTWSNQTHVEDHRGGATTETFLNPLPLLNGGLNAAKTITVDSTQSAQSVLAATGSSQIFSTGLVINSNALAGGSNVYPDMIQGTDPYFKTTFTGLALNGTNNTLGQHVLFGESQNCYGVGDCLMGGLFMQASGGFRDDADEGSHPFDRVFTEDTRVFTGTCASGCSTGSTLVQITATANNGTQGEGRYLLNTNPAKAITGGTLTGAGAAGGRQPSATFSGVNFPVSVFLETAQTIPTQSNSINPGTVTVAIATSSLPSGFANNTAALPASSGVACVSDVTFPDQRPLNFETAAYTVIDGSHLQITLIRPHANGATIAVGGLCGYGIEQKVDTLNGIRQVFPVIGSPTSTTLLYAGGYSSIVGTQGQTSAYMNASLTVASIARTGNVVTVTTTANPVQDLNGLTMTVQSVADPSYNGSFTVTTTGPNTITYANSGPNSTSSGGSLSYITGSYGLYPMAEVLNVYNTTTKAVDGQMTLAANTISWAVGDTVEQPHYFQEWVSDDTDLVTQYTPRATRYQSAGILYQGNNGTGLYGWQITNGDPASSYFGNGGTHTAPTSGMNIEGVWKNSMEMQAGESAVFDVHCNSHACNRWNSGYDLFHLDSATGTDRFSYTPSTSTMSYSLGGTAYSLSPTGLTAGTINASTVNAGTITGSFTGQAATVGSISGLVAAGSNVTVTGSGTAASPYTIASSGGGGGGVVNPSATINIAGSQTQADSLVGSTAYGLVALGDSIFSGAGSAISIPQVVCNDANISPCNNYAVAGANSQDLAVQAFTKVNPQDSGNPIVIALSVGNNVGAGAPGLPDFKRTTYAYTAWSAMSATSKIFMNNASVTLTGTTTPDSTFTNAPGMTCSTGPCTYTYTAVVPPTGVFYLFYKMLSTGSTIVTTANSGSGAVTLTDTVTSSASVSSAWTYAPNQHSYTVGMARYVATPGSNTVVVTVGSGVTLVNFAFPPSLRYRSPSAPRVGLSLGIAQPGYTDPATLYNPALTTLQSSLVGDGLFVPLIDSYHQVDANLAYVSTPTQNCAATQQAQHPNQCAANLIGGLITAAMGVAPSTWSGSGGYSSPVTTAGPIVANYPVAAASVSQFTSFQPHSYTDALIGGIQLCAPNGSERCGIKQLLDYGTGSYGVSMFETNPAKEIANCWSSTANPTADSAFNCASWFTSDGVIHGSGLSISGSVPTTLPGTLTVNDVAAVTSASSFSHLNPHAYSDALIDKWNVCSADICGIGMMNNAQGFGPGLFSTNTAKAIYLGCWSSVSNPTSEGQFNCPVWASSAGVFTANGAAMNGNKITGVANGSAATDVAAFGQLNGPVTGNLTLTAATTDSLTIAGVTTSSKCSFTATNATAAGVVGTLAGYYTLSANTFTLHHVATSAASATYGVVCSLN